MATSTFDTVPMHYETFMVVTFMLTASMLLLFVGYVVRFLWS